MSPYRRTDNNYFITILLELIDVFGFLDSPVKFSVNQKNIILNNIVDDVYYDISQHDKVISFFLSKIGVDFLFDQLKVYDHCKTILKGIISLKERGIVDIEIRAAIEIRWPLEKNNFYSILLFII